MSRAATLRSRTRWLGAVTAVVGAGLLVRPHHLPRWVSGQGRTPAAAVVRVLGGRQLLQGVLQIAYPDEDLVRGGVMVDGLHLLSMITFAALWPAYRRAALASGALAAVSAGAGAAILAAAPSTQGAEPWATRGSARAPTGDESC